MAFWANSFSDLAVSGAVSWLKEIDRESTAYVTFLSPKLYEELFEYSNSLEISEKQRMFALTSTDFFAGVVQQVLEHFYDGNAREYEKYETLVLKEAFNFGFLANFSKSYQKTLVQLRRNQTDHYRRGVGWFREVFLEQCIQHNTMLAELEAEKKAEEDRLYKEEQASLEVANSEKFKTNFVDNENERFDCYHRLLSFERQIQFSLALEDSEGLANDRQYEVIRSINEFGDFVPTELALKICTIAQKIMISCGLETEFKIHWIGLEKTLHEDKFHKLRNILEQKNGFKLSELMLPEPTNASDVLLMHEDGARSLYAKINLKCYDKKSFPRANDFSLMDLSGNFSIKPSGAVDGHSNLHQMYKNLSESEDRFEEFKADAIADILVERQNIVSDFLALHSSWGDERNQLYKELLRYKLKELYEVINEHVLFRLVPESGLIVYSAGDLTLYERTDYYEEQGTFFDSFDKVILERLGVLGQTECPSKVDDLENRLSPSVFFALHMERILAPYSRIGSEADYRNLSSEISEKNGLDLDRRSIFLW